MQLHDPDEESIYGQVFHRVINLAHSVNRPDWPRNADGKQAASADEQVQGQATGLLRG